MPDHQNNDNEKEGDVSKRLTEDEDFLVRRRRKDLPDGRPVDLSSDETHSDQRFGDRNDVKNSFDGTNRIKPEPPSGDLSAAREEYTKSLNQWMYQCYCWNWFRVLSCQSLLPPTTAVFVSANLAQSSARSTASAGATETSTAARVYVIPTLWKRAAAEFVDFVFLLLIKIMVTCIALDYFELIDYGNYEGSLLEEDFDPYQIAYKWSSEILIIEVIHRLIVIIFEALFLRSTRTANSPGGATPGKMMFGLRVISCSQVTELTNGTIQILPGGDIGFWRSLLRALIKNLSSIFFLPTSLTVFLSTYNRAAYDFVCKSIVVEEISLVRVRGH